MILIERRFGIGRPQLVVAGDPVFVLKEREILSLKAWTDFFLGQIPQGINFPDMTTFLGGVKSGGTIDRPIFLENQKRKGHIGEEPEWWTFLKPVQFIDTLLPEELQSSINSLGQSLNLRPRFIRQVINQSALLYSAGVNDVALELGKDRIVRLSRTRSEEEYMRYYFVARVREQGLILSESSPIEEDCCFLIATMRLKKSDFVDLFRRFLIFSSHAATGDDYYKFLQTEQSFLRSTV